MTLTERINQDIKTAMKAKDKDSLKVLRMLKAALQKEALEQPEPFLGNSSNDVILWLNLRRRDARIWCRQPRMKLLLSKNTCQNS